tara:strand:- start:148 stop:282 length:135 start_codon:yes stop_codon:yes gene_type:complete
VLAAKLEAIPVDPALADGLPAAPPAPTTTAYGEDPETGIEVLNL